MLRRCDNPCLHRLNLFADQISVMSTLKLHQHGCCELLTVKQCWHVTLFDMMVHSHAGLLSDVSIVHVMHLYIVVSCMQMITHIMHTHCTDLDMLRKSGLVYRCICSWHKICLKQDLTSSRSKRWAAKLPQYGQRDPCLTTLHWGRQGTNNLPMIS